jgi:outer membrane protein TolC
MLYKNSLSLIIGYLMLSFNYVMPTYAQQIQAEEEKPKYDAESLLKERSATSRFDSSGNPLLFPTKPEEVEIDEKESISLEEAISIALNNNKELQAARLELKRAEDALRAELGKMLPFLDTTVEFNQRADDQVSLDRDGFVARDRTLLQGDVELGYDVYTGGRRGAEIERARRELQFNRLEVERIAENTRFDATSSYYELQNADAQVAIAQAAVEDTSQTLRDAQLLEQAGLGTRFDVLQAEVDLANANQGLTRAIADQRNARRQLAQVLGVGQHVELTAADPVEESGVWQYSLENSIVMAYKNRAELEQLLVQREINTQDKEIALSEIRPQFQLFANYNFTETFFDGSTNALGQNSEGYADGYVVGARLRWRIFDGGQAFNRAEEEARSIQIDETNFANQREQIRLEVENAYYNMVANKENISTTEQAVITATESLRLARLRFQAGVGIQTDVINAQRSLTDARGNFLRAVIGYNQSLNQLQRAVSNLPDSKLFKLK